QPEPGRQLARQRERLLGRGHHPGQHDSDVGSGNIEGRGVLASLHGTVRFGGGGYLQGAVTGGSTDLDIERAILLGQAVRVESGSTSASSLGADLSFGWLFGEPGNLQ